MSDRSSNVAVQEAFGSAIASGDSPPSRTSSRPTSSTTTPRPAKPPDRRATAILPPKCAAFPAMAVEIQTLWPMAIRSRFAYTLTGTHNGDFRGHPPTGKAISVRGMQISPYRDGKLVERWGSTDELGILTKLGLT